VRNAPNITTTRWLYCVEWIQCSICLEAVLYGPTRVLGISVTSGVFRGLTRWPTDRPTDHVTQSV